MHQGFYRHVNDDTLQPDRALQIILIVKLITGLQMFHRKYIKSHVFRFISGAPVERNLEIFAAIVKLTMLFYAIIVFAHFTRNPTLLASRDGFQTYMIESMVNIF